MPWVRFDDTFPIHRKVEGLSDAAFRLHVSAIFWCARNLTDGFIPEHELRLISSRVRAPLRLSSELVARELWLNVEGGWSINDYLDFQPSKQKVLSDRESSAERQKKWRERNGVSNGVSNASHNGDRNTAPSRPVPSREQKKNQGSSSGARKARGTRIPEDFTVTPEMVEWARQRCPTVDGRRETEKFVNYWQAKSGQAATKVDWVATWKNWMLTAAERAPNRSAPPSGMHQTDANIAAFLQPTQTHLRALPGGES